MKECIDKMLVILPFEKEYYKNKWNWDVEYVGHPLVEVIEKVTSGKSGKSGQVESTKPIVALLPGSRKQEILKKLPIMLEVSRIISRLSVYCCKAPGMEDDFYESIHWNIIPMFHRCE